MKNIQLVSGKFEVLLTSKPINDSAIILYSGRINPERNKLFLSRFFEMKTFLGSTFFLIQQ